GWPGLPRALAVLFAALGLLGARRHWRAERRAAFAMTTLLVTLTLALVFYLNFRWGFSQPYRAAGLEHEVRERDYFFIASFALWGIWVGMGLGALMEWIEQGLAARHPVVARRWGGGGALATRAVPVALFPLVRHALTPSRSGGPLAGAHRP